MSFIYAKQLKVEFNVYGHFYQLVEGKHQFDCRSQLEIIRSNFKDTEESMPNAVVIMMNPGSSKPLDPEYKIKQFSSKQIFSKRWEKEFVATQPDNAQYQIMRLMKKHRWQHVRVINLSDLRNGNSLEFAKSYVQAEKILTSAAFCMNHSKRKHELVKCLNTSGPVIAAWGSLSVLKKAAEKTLKQFEKIAYQTKVTA
ncbi:MAG: hypothetical protein Q9M92_08110 [Enterobacterales bacterium]|nr:hypothetical protein [Enterobacterales bacterium]